MEEQRKIEIESIHDLNFGFSSATPPRNKEKSSIEVEETFAETLKKYGELNEIFNGMVCSVRLLGLKKRIPTFHKISRQVEILTGRKLLCKHLAQTKYLLPEAVQIEKILLHDTEPKCMKPDLKISFLLDVVSDHDEVSVYIALRKLFCSRLREFDSAYPDAFAVPEAELPDLFNREMITIEENLHLNSLTDGVNEVDVCNSTHLPHSFRRKFSEKTCSSDMEKTDIHLSVNSGCDVDGEIDVPVLLPCSSIDSVCENTPMKPLKGIEVATPSLSTPVRPISSGSVLTCEDENKKNASATSEQATKTAKKSLDFFGIDGQNVVLPHKQISARSSDFVFMIHQVFKSADFCPITKGELVHKIVMNKLDITDPSEVEMQLDRIEKLVPDWLRKKLLHSGDLIYKLKKVSDLNYICELVDASP